MKNFIRKKENFWCNNCGVEVVGDGYTDHCPNCLWGKHVDDKIPGDRGNKCRGAMRPVGVVYEKEGFRIYYECQRCGHKFRVREGVGDNREELIKLASGEISEKMR